MRKICTECIDEKPLEEFPKNYHGKYGVGQKCKKCSAGYAAKYRKENRTKIFCKKYNLLLDQYLKFLEQKSCDICKEEKVLVFDHCHKTGKIRGMICDTCNKGLGQFYDKPELLFEAAVYLKMHEKEYG